MLKRKQGSFTALFPFERSFFRLLLCSLPLVFSKSSRLAEHEVNRGSPFFSLAPHSLYLLHGIFDRTFDRIFKESLPLALDVHFLSCLAMSGKIVAR